LDYLSVLIKYMSMANILKINLSDKSYKLASIDKKIIKTYLGGRGLGAYLYSKSPKKAEDPDNSVFIVPGLLTGTMFPSSSRSFVVTSSPLTNYYTASSFGGMFGAFLKHSGISVLEMSGRSNTWHYLVVEDSKVAFKDAKDLMGKTVLETQEILQKKFKDRKVSIAAIGQGGENLVKFSSLMFDKRAAGRTGTGWHFGFKKIKAIVVVGGNNLEISENPQKVRKIIRELFSKKLENDKKKPDYATSAFTEWSNLVQTYPASNYRNNFVSGKDIIGLSGDTLKKFGVKKEACWSCPLACTRIVKDQKLQEVKGPEYETIWALGANCDNFDMGVVIKCNHLCDSFSLDTISTGGVLAWYKECIDVGLVRDKWSPDKMYKLIEETALRKGVGKYLADGVVVAAKHFGFGSELVAHSKGLELPAWDPRSAIGMAVSYATSPTGGDHCKGWTVAEDTAEPKVRFSIKGKAQNVIKQQNRSALIDSLGTCMFAEFLYDLDIWSQIISAFFGWKKSLVELNKVGEKVFDTEYKINKKLGHKLSENTLPSKIIDYEIKVDGEKVVLTRKMFTDMMRDYVKLRGW